MILKEISAGVLFPMGIPIGHRKEFCFFQWDAMRSQFTFENACFLVAADHADVGRIAGGEDLDQYRKICRVTLADQHEEGVGGKAFDETAWVILSELA